MTTYPPSIRHDPARGWIVPKTNLAETNDDGLVESKPKKRQRKRKTPT